MYVVNVIIVLKYWCGVNGWFKLVKNSLIGKRKPG